MQLVFLRGRQFFRLLILLTLLLLGTTFFGQTKNDSVKSHPVISVKNGASIYSLDESFNSQIINSNIVTDGKTKVEKTGSEQSLTIVSPAKTISPKITAKGVLEAAKQQKEKDSLIKVKKLLDTINGVKKNKVFVAPNSTENFGNQVKTKDHVAISLSHNDHKEQGISATHFSAIKRLDFLDAFRIYHLNNRSLAYSVIDYLPVRPPPAV